MAIRWYNIRSKEVVTAETEPQISALWASSDHSPNITQGQDFGWRLAPEIVVKMKTIKQDYHQLLDIAKIIGKNVDEVNEPDILTFISETDNRAADALAQDGDYTDEYEQAIRDEELKAAEERGKEAGAPAGVESLEDLQKRVELEERLAAARAANQAPAATQETVTTTTTTEVPTTTTTTTKKK